MLKKQILDIPLYGGVDTKTDDFQVSTGKVLELQNADLSHTGTVRKRSGYEILGNERVESPLKTVGEVNTVTSWNNQLIVIGEDGYEVATSIHAGPKVFTYSDASEKWFNSGVYSPIEFDVDRVSSSDSTVRLPTVAQGNGYTLFGYRMDTDEGAKINAHVTESFNTIAHQLATIADGWNEIRLHYLESADGETKAFSALCFYPEHAGGANFGRWRWDCDPATIGFSSNWTESLYTDGNEDGVWDACSMTLADGSINQLLAYKRVNTHIYMKVFNAANTEILNTAGLVLDPSYSMAVNHIIDEDGTGRVFLMWQKVADEDIYIAVYDDDLLPIVIPTVVDREVGHLRAGNMTIARDPQWDPAGSDTKAFTFAYEILDTDGDGYQCDTRIIVLDEELKSLGYTYGSADYQGRFGNATLQAEAYTYENKAYFVMGQNSDYQSTYFTTSYQPHPTTDAYGGYVNIHCKMLYAVAGPQRTFNHTTETSDTNWYSKGLSETINPTTGNYVFSGLKQNRLLTTGDVQYSVQQINLNMSPDPVPIVNVGPSAVIGGGQIGMFDGRMQQLGFPIYPENIRVSNIHYVNPGKVDTGLHYYKFVYEWFDNKGQVYRSSPSPPLEVYVGGSDIAIVVFRAPQCSFSNWETQKNITLHAYRTTVLAGNVYYKSPSCSVNASFTDEWVFLNDQTSDADIISQEVLYTTGGVLENTAPPASNIIAAKNDRIFMVPMDDRQAVVYSKPKVDTVGFEFAAEFTIRLDIDGDNTGLAYMDDKLIIFKEKSIYYIYGAGPNSQGRGVFSPPQPIASDVGCVNHNSIVLMPHGLMFKSQKGIYILDRSLQVTYIGAPVEDYNQYDVVSATLVEDKNNIIFLLSGGQPALVFDYYHNQWSTYYNHTGKDACMHQGKYTFATTSDRIKRNTPGAFVDGSFVIPLLVKTGWIQPAGLQRWMRVYSFSLLGHFKSGHKIKIKVYQDYNDTNVTQTFEFDTSTGQSGDEPLQFTGNIANQKCQAIQFEIYDDDRLSTYESMELTAISLEVGIKQGLNKQPIRKKL